MEYQNFCQNLAIETPEASEQQISHDIHFSNNYNSKTKVAHFNLIMQNELVPLVVKSFTGRILLLSLHIFRG